MPTLEQIDAHEARITRAGLVSLKTLTRLHTLFLGSSISDDDIADLAKLKSIKRLDLRGARISDESAQALGDMAQLEELALTDTEVTPTALSALGRLPYLRYLEMSGTSIKPQDLVALSGMVSLQVLSFSSERRLKAADLKPLAELPNLHSVIVNGVLLGPKLLGALREPKTSSRLRILEWLLPYVEAASEGDVEQALEVASAPELKERRPFAGFQGLKRIHEAESSIDQVVPAMPTAAIKTQEDTQENFLGEITIQAGGKIEIKK
jgi:hypothetical protein